MHIDVDLCRVEFQIKRRRRMTVARQEIGISAPQGTLKQPVSHRPTIHEQMLMGPIAAVVGWQAGVAQQSHTLSLLVQLNGVIVEVAPQYSGEPRQTACRTDGLSRQAQHAATVDVEREADLRMGHGLSAHLVGDGQAFSALGLHKFESRRCCIEQVAHLHPRSMRTGECGGLGLGNCSAVDLDGPGVAGVLGP